MYSEKNNDKAYFKVEPKMGDSPDGQGDWVAMTSHDSTGTEYFYGGEQQCWDHIDGARAVWRELGIELVRQTSRKAL